MGLSWQAGALRGYVRKISFCRHIKYKPILGSSLITVRVSLRENGRAEPVLGAAPDPLLIGKRVLDCVANQLCGRMQREFPEYPGAVGTDGLGA